VSGSLSVNYVLQKFRDLESGPGGGVLPVVLQGDGVPQRVVGRLGFVAGLGGFTPEAVEIMNELRELEQTPDGRAMLLQGYARFETEEEDE
jgi:hypothetical protein